MLGVGLDKHSADQAILQTAIDVRDKDHEKPTVFVTMDTNLRIRADAVGIPSETYENQQVSDDEMDRPFHELAVDGETVDKFFMEGHVVPPDPSAGPRECGRHAHRCVVAEPHGARALRRDEGRDRRAPYEGVLGVRLRQPRAVVRARRAARRVDPPWSRSSAKRARQDAPRDRRRSQAHDRGRHLHAHGRLASDHAARSRPRLLAGRRRREAQPVDAAHLRQPRVPLLERIDEERSRLTRLELLESGTIQVEPLTYIRGRSLPHQYLIVDEAQNLTPHEVKTIITRCGEGTKIVLTGDPEQIDNPYVDHSTNGLSVVAERFKKERIAAHMVLAKGERSELAELAANLL